MANDMRKSIVFDGIRYISRARTTLAAHTLRLNQEHRKDENAVIHSRNPEQEHPRPGI